MSLKKKTLRLTTSRNSYFAIFLTSYYQTSFAFILRFPRAAKYRRGIVNERDPNFSCFQRVGLQQYGIVINLYYKIILRPCVSVPSLNSASRCRYSGVIFQ